MRNIDHGVCYERILSEYLAQPIRILELGAGTGQLARGRDHRPAKIWGLDPDPRVQDNPHIDVACINSIEQADFNDESFDLICSRFVFEHLSDPTDSLNHCFRWLQPGGKMLILTVNRLHHLCWMKRFVPDAVHEHLTGRNDDDIFPTYYRFNNPFEIPRQVAASRFGAEANVTIYLCEKYPFINSAILRIVEKMYSLIVNAFDFLRWFRVGMIIEIVKPSAPLIMKTWNESEAVSLREKACE